MKPDERATGYFLENLGIVVMYNPAEDYELSPMAIRRLEMLRHTWTEADLASPIEWQLFAYLLFCWDCGGHTYQPNVPDVQWDVVGTYLDTQHRVGPYTVDFMVTVKSGDKTECVAIECDGHDFHERTKEQAAHDKKRDRFLVASGITVLRFTGSEIYKDPWQCCKEIMKVVNDARTRVGFGPEPEAPRG
jgi:very-short-patch-repair endonuclease